MITQTGSPDCNRSCLVARPEREVVHHSALNLIRCYDNHFDFIGFQLTTTTCMLLAVCIVAVKESPKLRMCFGFWLK